MHPEQQIRELEMNCVKEYGTKFPSKRPHVRQFFQQLDFVVGASQGIEVNYIYVEWHQAGAVHGRPISEEELRRKGAPI